MKKMKRIISAALTLALAAGMLAGCAGSSSGTPAASSAGGASAGSSSAERERITVRVFRSKASHEVAMDQMDVFKVMGEMFNIDFEFDNPPQENYTERLNLVMMETELPDVIMEIPVTDVLKYGETGVILPLNDYIENSMPNLKAEMDKRDDVEKALTYSDGNIYYLPMLDETPSGNIPYIVRTDWLDQLGLERPVTIEDWENYWSLVKTTDLNGNGKNDEIPFSAYEIERLRNFCTAWGVLDDFYTDPTDGGKVHYGPIEDKYKEALVWMNDMWNKGYIDQEIITTDYSAFSAKLAQNIVGSFAGPLGGMLAAQNATMAESVPGFHVAANGVENDDQPFNGGILLDGHQLGDNVFVFGCFVLGRQDVVPLNLPDDGQAVDDVFPFSRGDRTGFDDLFGLVGPLLIQGTLLFFLRHGGGGRGPAAVGGFPMAVTHIQTLRFFYKKSLPWRPGVSIGSLSAACFIIRFAPGGICAFLAFLPP